MGSALRAPAFRLGMMKPRPIRPSMIHQANSQNEVLVSTLLIRNDDNAKITSPNMTVA